MNVARFSRITGLLVAVGLLAACSDKQDTTPADTVATGRSLPHSATDAIAPEDAHNYIGQTRTVCGTVASARYATRTKGQPTYLNLNQPYPNHTFTVVIWGSDRFKFSEPPDSLYRDKRISVTGRIVEYRGKTQIVVKGPSQIVVNE